MNFNAYYDVTKDRIINANPYTYEWFHERRHQQQFKTLRWLRGFNQRLEILSYGLSAGFLLGMLTQMIPFILGVLLIGLSNLSYAFLNLVLELDAILFGTIAWIKHKRNL